VATPPPNDNGGGDKEAPNQEEYMRRCQACILAREASLYQQQEEFNALVQKLDCVFGDVGEGM
jgi:hypothetical protein